MDASKPNRTDAVHNARVLLTVPSRCPDFIVRSSELSKFTVERIASWKQLQFSVAGYLCPNKTIA